MGRRTSVNLAKPSTFSKVKIIVGNKTDLQAELPVNPEDVQAFAAEIGAPAKFTSCRSGEGVVVIAIHQSHREAKEVFETAGELIVTKQDTA